MTKQKPCGDSLSQINWQSNGDRRAGHDGEVNAGAGGGESV